MSLITLIMPTGAAPTAARRSREEFVSRAKMWYAGYGLEPVVLNRPDLTAFETTTLLLRDVKTPYVAFAADDDFLLPSALAECVIFLEQNSDYTVCHGNALQFGIQQNLPWGRIDWIAPYRQDSFESPLPWRRMIGYLHEFMPIAFSVQRTDVARLAHDSIIQLKPILERIGTHESRCSSIQPGVKAYPQDFGSKADRRNFDQWGELITAALPVFFGKVKKLDCLYMMRQMHPSSAVMVGRGIRYLQFRRQAWRWWSEFSIVHRFLETGER